MHMNKIQDKKNDWKNLLQIITISQKAAMKTLVKICFVLYFSFIICQKTFL